MTNFFDFIIQPEEASRDVAIDLFDEVTMTHWEKPPYIPQREQLAKESNLYAYPSALPGTHFH